MIFCSTPKVRTYIHNYLSLSGRDTRTRDPLLVPRGGVGDKHVDVAKEWKDGGTVAKRLSCAY